MLKLPRLPQSSIKKLPIFDKSLATFNFEDVNGLKSIGECINKINEIFSFNGCTYTELDIVAARNPSFMGFLGFLICAKQGLF